MWRPKGMGLVSGVCQKVLSPLIVALCLVSSVALHASPDVAKGGRVPLSHGGH